MLKVLQPGVRFKKNGKPSIIRWRGLLADHAWNDRLLTFLFLAVVAFSLSFTQFGFIGLGTNGYYAGYAVALLAPVALGALLLGVWLCTLLGAVCGGMMLLHALLQPLDVYELNFITPTSSVVLLTVTAFFAGLFMAIALRNDPPKWWKRVLYIAIVSILISGFYSTMFVTGVIIEMVIDLVATYSNSGTTLDNDELQLAAIVWAGQIGHPVLQMQVDALIMFVVCTVADLLKSKIEKTRENWSLRTTFRLRLFGMVFLVFVVTAAAGFIVITEQAKSNAHEEMLEEIDYLAKQLERYDARNASLVEVALKDVENGSGLDEGDVEKLSNLLSIDDLLDGYTVENDGVILILVDDIVLFSDDPNYKRGNDITDYIDLNDNLKLADVVPDGELLQITYDPTAVVLNGVDDISKYMEKNNSNQIAFLTKKKVGDYTVVVIRSSQDVFKGRDTVIIWTSISVLSILVVVFLGAAWLLNKIVVRRIDETNAVLAKITDGDLNARVDIRDSREFKSLSGGVNTTVDALKGWISEAERRMDQELATAKAIQESALPRTFPPFPDIRKFDIFASMKPAREVGGDFYDFFLVGDDCNAENGKLGFVLADVSGKGVPAALFMMAAMTEIRNYLSSGIEPGEAIENANRRLCEGNDAGMFVTAFAGVLEYGTGRVTYVNAGHNPPLIWQQGSWRWLKDVSGMPLGLFDGFPYDQYELKMGIGDFLYTYTDGVTEAMNVDGELFGEDRLEALANKWFYLHPRRFAQKVRQKLARYTHGAEQSDDITMLALEYGVPPELTASLAVPADTERLRDVLDFIHDELDRRLCPTKAQKQLDIAIEELFVNVAHYAYPDATPDNPGIARITYTYSAEPPSIKVDIADDGIPYNPLAKPDAVTPDDIMEVPIGGLGILMAKKSVDKMEYERVDNSNVVSITKKW